MNLAKFVSALILLGMNFVLALGGVFVLVVGISLRKDAWIDVLQGYWSHTDDVLTAIIVVGSVVIGLAVFGSIAACFRWRFGLLVYSWLIFFGLFLFLAIAIAAFVLRGTARDWESVDYPANSDEVTVKEKFDEVYCYAQGEYVCNEMPVADVLEMFVPSVNSSITDLFANYSGINAVCNDLSSLSSTVSELESVCESCAIAEQYENLSSIVDWANDKCPRTNETMLWCGNFLTTGDLNSTVGTAPYTQCRQEFLDFVESRALWTGIGGILVVAGVIMIIGFSCFLRRRERRHERSSFMHHATNDDPETPPVHDTRYNKV